MDWTRLGTLAVVLAVLAAQLPAVRRQCLEDREGAIKTLRLLVYYFIYAGIGIAVLVSAIPEGSGAMALAAVGFLLGWLLLGVSWMIKVVPKYKRVATWLLKPVSALDVAALIAIVVSLAALFG